MANFYWQGRTIRVFVVHRVLVLDALSQGTCLCATARAELAREIKFV